MILKVIFLPILNNSFILQTCTLNVIGTCPQPSSCVRSTTNQAICCETTVACPDGRRPYYIPGSSSVVACNPDGDNCPGNNVCVESRYAWKAIFIKISLSFQHCTRIPHVLFRDSISLFSATSKIFSFIFKEKWMECAHMLNFAFFCQK